MLFQRFRLSVYPNPHTLRNWALASVYAYRAYKQDYLLYKATSIWDKMNEYLVTSDDAASGTHPLRTVLFNSSCTGGIILLSLITKYDLSNKLTGNAGAVLVVSVVRFRSNPSSWISSSMAILTPKA